MAQQTDPKFDPYWEWLKIPPEQQPPNHYRLLGLKPFEEDQAAIDGAVNRLVERLQRLSQGPKVESAQKILNQVALARLCFTDPQKKQIYDSQLKARLLNPPAAKEPATQGAESGLTAVPAKPPQRKSTSPKAPIKSAPCRKVPAANEDDAIVRKIKLMRIATAAMLVMGALFGACFVWMAFGGKTRASATRQVTQQSKVTKPVEEVTQTPSAAQVKSDTLAQAQSQPDEIPKVPATEGIAGQIDGAQQTVQPTPSQPSTASSATPDIPGQSAAIALAAPKAATDMGTKQPVAPPATTPGSNPTANTTSNLPNTTPTSGDSAPAPSPATATGNGSGTAPASKLQAIPDQPGTYAPSRSTDFAEYLKAVVGLQGTVVKARTSTSGKTVYLMFSTTRNELIEVRARAGAIGLPEFEKLVGKLIRVRGELKEEFGSKIIGLEIKSLDEIEILK